jgi:glycerol-3-phosphate dehydrogenase
MKRKEKKQVLVFSLCFIVGGFTMYDVIIIGAGISGTTLARELSRYNLKIAVLEKEYDIATEATMANSAIVHSGHDPLPGTLKARFNIIGNRMYKQMSEELDIPYMPCGGLVVATTKEEEDMIDVLYERGLQNGLMPDEIGVIFRDEIVQREPNISKFVTKALDVPTTAVTFPWEAAIANMENAMDNGAELFLETRVIKISKDTHFTIETTNGLFEGKVVINASGVYADQVQNTFMKANYTISARRGEYYVLDKDVYEINSVIYPVPSEKGKGVIITPQYHGNVLLGPTSDVVPISEMSKTTPAGLEYVKEHAQRSVTNIPYHKVIRSFAGGRASSSTHDFVINDVNDTGFINVAGIESPGLTAAPAIAVYVTEELVSKHLILEKKALFNPYRRKVVRLAELSVDERNQLVKEDPRYGKIVCRCEQITEGEVIDSINRNCGGRSIVGVKNRVRAGAGRCQGGFCQTEVIRILSEQLNIDKMKVNYRHKGSYILKGRTKGETS